MGEGSYPGETEAPANHSWRCPKPPSSWMRTQKRGAYHVKPTWKQSRGMENIRCFCLFVATSGKQEERVTCAWNQTTKVKQHSKVWKLTFPSLMGSFSKKTPQRRATYSRPKITQQRTLLKNKCAMAAGMLWRFTSNEFQKLTVPQTQVSYTRGH